MLFFVPGFSSCVKVQTDLPCQDHFHHVGYLFALLHPVGNHTSLGVVHVGTQALTIGGQKHPVDAARHCQ